MASLQEVCELSWRQIFPNPGDETSITKEEFIATGKYEWAYQTLLASWGERQLEGYYEVPSYLTDEIELEVINNEMDIGCLKTFKSLPQEIWLQGIGEMNCGCTYVKSTFNLNALLCEDDSLPDTTKTYYVQGKKIKFPKGVHKTPLRITYATMGADFTGEIQIDEAVASLVRAKLNEMYLGKVAAADTTNNSNSNN